MELTMKLMNKDEHVHIPPAAFPFMTRFYDSLLEVFGFGVAFKQRILDMLHPNDGDILLDIGVGTGTFLALAAAALPHSHIIGIDPDRGALAIAKQKLSRVRPDIDLYEAIAEQLPIADKSVDVVVSTLVFHHLSRSAKAQAIREVYRVIRPGGQFLLVDFGKPVSMLSRILLFIGSFIDGRDNVQANLEGVLETHLREAGFSMEEVAVPYHGVRFLMAKK